MILLCLWRANHPSYSPDFFLLMFTDYNSYSLSAKEGWERQEELNSTDEGYRSWCVTLPTGEYDYIEDEAEKDEHVADLLAQGITPVVTELPF